MNKNELAKNVDHPLVPVLINQNRNVISTGKKKNERKHKIGEVLTVPKAFSKTVNELMVNIRTQKIKAKDSMMSACLPSLLW